jgi:hypothetical protein
MARPFLLILVALLTTMNGCVYWSTNNLQPRAPPPILDETSLPPLVLLTSGLDDHLRDALTSDLKALQRFESVTYLANWQDSPPERKGIEVVISRYENDKEIICDWRVPLVLFLVPCGSKRPITYVYIIRWQDDEWSSSQFVVNDYAMIWLLVLLPPLYIHGLTTTEIFLPIAVVYEALLNATMPHETSVMKRVAQNIAVEVHAHRSLLPPPSPNLSSPTE